MPRLQNKIALITGAAQGVGRATAELAARAGATVVLVDRDESLCRDALATIVAEGGVGSAIGADLHSYEGNAIAVDELLSRHGRIDAAVFNVGGAIRPKPFWEYSPAELEAEIGHSLWPTLWGCRVVVPIMREQKSGVIVNVGSAAVRWLWRSPYSAAKAGIHTFTNILARELRDCGIRVACVAPGALAIDDRITLRDPSVPEDDAKAWRTAAIEQSLASTPLGRAGTAEEIAAVIGFLMSDEASYVTGTTVFAAGGETS